MTAIKNEQQYELSLERIEELLKVVGNDTPSTDKNFIELGLLSDLVADYGAVHSIHIYACGNSPISMGLAALLAKLFNGLTPEQLRQTAICFDLETGLLDNLSYNRKSGLLEMIGRLK